MKRIVEMGIVLLAMALPACLHAGVLLWQVKGMEGIEKRYSFANRWPQAVLPEGVHVEALWMLPGAYTTAAAVMKGEIWQDLQAWLVRMGRVATDETVVPTYPDLVTSGLISINGIAMPELMGNRDR